MKVHGLDVDVRHNQSRSDIARRAYGTKDVCRCVPLITRHARARAALAPDAGQRAFLSNTRFGLEPELDGFAFGIGGDDFRNLGGEVFLKVSIVSGSFLGLIGRVVNRTKPRRRSNRPTDTSCKVTP